MSNSLKFNPEYQKIVGGLWYDIKSKLERLNIPTLTSFLKLNEILYFDQESKLNSIFYIFHPNESSTASIYHQLKKTIPPKKFSLLHDYFSKIYDNLFRIDDDFSRSTPN